MVSIVNPDGSETPLETHPATVDVRIGWQNSMLAPQTISGLTAPTLLPPALVPGGLEPVPQEPFLSRFFATSAVGSFKAVAKADDGSDLKTFAAAGINSAFAEVGFTSIGKLLVGPTATLDPGSKGSRSTQ